MPSISALVLCGGKSSRMGQPKAFIEVRGKRLIDHVVDVARTLASEVLLVSPPSKELEVLGLPLVTEEKPGLGPLEGLRVGIDAAQGELVYAFSCDLPNIDAPPLEKLLGFLGEGDAVIPRSAQGLEPLCALYRKGCASIFADQIARGERAIHRAAQALRAVHPATANLGVQESFFDNLNTRDDLARLNR